VVRADEGSISSRPVTLITEHEEAHRIPSPPGTLRENVAPLRARGLESGK